MKEWDNLQKPPVIVALFQIRYTLNNIKLADFMRFDSELRKTLPLRTENVNAEIEFPNTTFNLGVSKITATSNASINLYIYLTNDQKRRIEISENAITFIDESPYLGWSHFKDNVQLYMSIISELLCSFEINRISIRYINRFVFSDFDNPLDYFKTLISSSEDSQLPYPLREYGFRLFMDIPNSDTTAIVNQRVTDIRSSNHEYIFDIDVLNHQNIVFNVSTISSIMESLREVKNEIFFNNLTQKTLDLCN